MRNDFSLKTKELLAKRVGYKCSSPSCRRSTTGPKEDSFGSVNIGVAAHITAAAPGGPRFDLNLAEKQRGAYENGIWLCQACAKLVDNDSDKYSVEVLGRWKQEAEAAAQQELEHPGAAEVAPVYVDKTSIVSINQSGGQVAKTIINPMPVPRSVSFHEQQIVDRLSILPPLDYIIRVLSGDSEARNLADQLDAVLTKAGWSKKNILTHLTGSFLPGIVLFRDRVSDGSQALLEVLVSTGMTVLGQKEFRGEEINIYIGANPDKYQ